MANHPERETVFGKAIADHQNVIATVADQQELLEEIARTMAKALHGGNQILWCGNGGSAGDSQHLAAETLWAAFAAERRGLPSIALTTDTSILTSVANDYGYEMVFSRQVEAMARPGDVLVGISTSGNSRNVVAALEAARLHGVITVAFTGEGGGRMGDLADYLFAVSSRDTARIQEAHILAGHMICDWLELDWIATEAEKHGLSHGGSGCCLSEPLQQLHTVIEKIEQEWPKKRLLVLGDVMLDKYIWGEVGRISPEAPVPVVRATHQSEQPGGAANVAMNLAKLGAGVALVGFTGGDADEALLAASLKANGIDPAFVACDGFPTITKTRIVGGRQQMLRLDSENLSKRPDADHDRLLAKVLEELPRCHAVVLSDYAKGVLAPALCQAVIAAARKLGVPVLVDPKTADFSRCTKARRRFAPTCRSFRQLRARIFAIWTRC